MTDFLLFTLYAPLASWGDIAVGESRGSWDRPSRSAVLGLLGAALGLVREDQDAHDALAKGYGVAVRVDATGAPLSDYHTAQTVGEAAVRKSRPRTRAQLLAAGEPQTILSRRASRQDALATIAVWVRGDAGEAMRWTLAELARVLETPAFVLYAGRKANALGAPTGPQVVTAATLREAFVQRPPIPPARQGGDTTVARTLAAVLERGIRGGRAWGREVSFDAIRADVDGFASGFERIFRRDVRRDVPTHRARWQFAERVVEVGLMDGGESAGAAAGGAS